MPWIRSSVFGRYDWLRWKPRAGDESTGRTIVGLAHYFYERCAVVVDLDDLQQLSGAADPDWASKLTLQVLYP